MSAEAHARSLYRSILRELPHRSLSLPPSPLRSSIRKHFANPQSTSSSSDEYKLARRQELDQFVQYLRAQRMYGTLVERYNPGMSMSEGRKSEIVGQKSWDGNALEWSKKVGK